MLAGGFGQRLAPLTTRVPKVLAPAHGRPFLDYQLEQLRRQGFESVLLLVGHLGSQIEARYGGGTAFTPRITYAVDDPPRGTLGALSSARTLLDQAFLLLNGDTYLDLDLQQVAGAASGAQVEATVVASPPAGAPPNLRVADEKVTAYRKEGLAEGTHVAAGAVVIRRSTIELTPAATRDQGSLEDDVLPRLAAAGRLGAFVTTAPYFDIGTPGGLAAFERYLGR